MGLKDRVAPVVGAGRQAADAVGNGRATAILLACEGARAVAVDDGPASARETAATIRAEGGDCVAGRAM